MRPGVPGAVWTPRTELAYRFPGLRPYRDRRRVRQPGRSGRPGGQEPGPFGINGPRLDARGCGRGRLELLTSVHASRRSSHDDDCTHDRSCSGHRGDPGRRSCRRPHRRRRGLRHRRRVPPAGPVPRPDLRHPGRPGQPGRNLVDPPVPGRALRQRPVHLRLPVQAVARPVDRGGRGDPRLPRRGHRRGRPRPVHPLPAPGHRGQLVHRGPPVDRRGHPGRHRAAAAVHHRLPVDVPGLLQPRQALPARVGRHGPLPGPGRAPPAVARGPRPSGQARRRDRLRRHGRDADPRDSREG